MSYIRYNTRGSGSRSQAFPLSIYSNHWSEYWFSTNFDNISSFKFHPVSTHGEPDPCISLSIPQKKKKKKH